MTAMGAKKPDAPHWLTHGFWIDPLVAPPKLLPPEKDGIYEVAHAIRRQNVERVLAFQLEELDDASELVLLAAWDPRAGWLVREDFHRRYDHHRYPYIYVDFDELPIETIEFIADWGLEAEAEGWFTGDIKTAFERIGRRPWEGWE